MANRKSPKRAYFVLGTVVALGILVYGSYSFLAKDKVNTDDAQIEAEVVPLSARVSGVVGKVLAHDNQTVKKGDVIAELEPLDYEIRIAQAEAELEATLAQAESSAGKGATVNFAQIESAKAAVARADAELRKATTDLARDRKLKTENAISTVELETAQNNVDKAAAAADQARAQMKVAEQQHSVANAKVKAAEAMLKQAQTQLSYTRIVAPRDGSLSKLAVQEGQLVQAGQLVAQLVDSQAYVIANFKETQVGRMLPGQRAEIAIDAFPGKHFEGKVESLAFATGARFSLMPPDNASGNFVKVVQRVPVKILLDGAQQASTAFRAGLSADATIFLK